MVRGIFCHDLPIYKDINGVYCSTTMTDDLFSRYFDVVDELVVATRIYPINKTYIEAHQEKISLPNISFIDIPNLNTFRALFGQMWEYKRKILEAARECDLFFLRGGINALLGEDAALKLGKPFLAECSGCAWESYWNHSFKGKLIAPYMEYRARKGTRRANYVIYVTEKWLQKRYPTNGEWTYASNVILKHVDDSCLEKRLEKIRSMEKKHIVIGTTAGLNRMKGQQYVIEAMNLLKDDVDIRYEMVGSGDKSYLISLAEKYGLRDKVIFKGQMNHEEVLAWLDNIDIYVQPSLQEGLPRSVIEALSRACPVIGSHTAGIPELIQPIFVFEQKSPRSIAEKIRVMLRSNKMEDSARVNIEKAKEYELDKLNERRRQLYKKYRENVINRK